MRVASTIQLGLSLFFAVVALALRGPIQDDLLEGNETLYWVFFSSVLFYAASYFARGFLAGEQRFGLFVAADPLRILLPHDLRRAGRGRHPQRPVGGRDRDHRRPGPVPRSSSPSPSPRRAQKEQGRFQTRSGGQRHAASGREARRTAGRGFSFRSGGGFAAAVL